MATAAAQTGKTRDARQLRSDAALRAALIALIGRQPYDKITAVSYTHLTLPTKRIV